jgi:hypothetical protein
MRKSIILFAVVLLSGGKVWAQNRTDEELAYMEMITKRADKVVSPLELKDSVKYQNVKGIVVNQYLHINLVHEVAKSAKAKSDTATVRESKVRLDNLHQKYLQALSKELNPEQVNTIKDGMTYNVLQVTYKAYQDMIPTLKEAEKMQILNWLTEARELAMDEGTSDAKHQIFGKFKGRINNYLSGLGYDLQAERKAWEDRIKVTKSN